MTARVPSRPRRGDRGAYAAALRLLAARELSVAQVRERLRRRSYPEPEIVATLARLAAAQAIDDRRAAVAAARRAASRHRGPARALREVEALGVSRDLARAAVAEVFGGADERELADRALARRARGPITTAAALRRLYQHLLRQGFSPSIAAAAVKAHATPEAWSRHERDVKE